MKQTYFHGSYETEIKIDDDSNRIFGPYLFFSGDLDGAGCLGQNETYFKIEVEEDNIINAEQLFYEDNCDCAAAQEVVDFTADMLELDEDVVCELISGETSTYDIESFNNEEAAEAGWFIQKQTAELAEAMGWGGVNVEDERGTSLMLNMKGRENELIKL